MRTSRAIPSWEAWVSLQSHAREAGRGCGVAGDGAPYMLAELSSDMHLPRRDENHKRCVTLKGWWIMLELMTLGILRLRG